MAIPSTPSERPPLRDAGQRCFNGEMLLEGIFLPVTTPFHADGRLYLAKLEANVDRYGRTPAAGLVMLTAAGEAEMLTGPEREHVLTTAIAAAAPEQVMIAAIAEQSVWAAVSLAETAAKAGYDAVAVSLPRQRTPAECRLFWEIVADRSPLPLVLVDSGSEQPAPVLALAEHVNVLGAINLNGSGAQVREWRSAAAAVSREIAVTPVFRAVTARMRRQAQPAESLASAESLSHGTAVAAPAASELRTRTKRVGFQILAGSAPGTLECLEAGAVGALLSLGPCVPQACCEIYQAWRDGDPALAAEKQDRITRAWHAVQGVAAIKYACDLNAYFGGRPRLPGLPLTGEQRLAVEAALAGMRN